MRTIVLLCALALASAAWAQEQKKEEAKEEAKPAAQEKTKPAPVAKKSSRRHQDARHCLEKGSNTEIIKCAEAYL
ncbi:MAG TPA: hypothetical protein VFZ81_08885 [Burkholderiales bacterium]